MNRCHTPNMHQLRPVSRRACAPGPRGADAPPPPDRLRTGGARREQDRQGRPHGRRRDVRGGSPPCSTASLASRPSATRRSSCRRTARATSSPSYATTRSRTSSAGADTAWALRPEYALFRSGVQCEQRLVRSASHHCLPAGCCLRTGPAWHARHVSPPGPF
jgi:hypothetical protein